MSTFPKSYLTPAVLVANLISKGMIITSTSEAEKAIKQIGYYRLKGYFLDAFDSTTGLYLAGTNFNNILKIYAFDVALSRLLLDYLLKIEVSLRARLIDALEIYHDPLVLFDHSKFADGKKHLENINTITNKISRSYHDEFIYHNLNTYKSVPIWAAVEVIEYGTLSKIMANLETGMGTAMEKILEQYKFLNATGAEVKPTKKMFISWLTATSVLRNICAHNGRIYNRPISVLPTLIATDILTPPTAGTIYGVYHHILAMKYLKPDKKTWGEFVNDLKSLLAIYSPWIDPAKLFFPADWANHII